MFAIINAYSFENLKPNWKKQREIWNNNKHSLFDTPEHCGGY